MTRKFGTFLSISTLVLFISSPMLAAQQPRPAAKAAPAAQERKEDYHGNVVFAQQKLVEAKQHLEKAAHDFGGYRVNAIHYIELAQAELEKALKYSAEHDKPGQ